MAKATVHPADEKKPQTGLNPIPPRKCRDVFWLILFVLFWIGMFVIAGFSFKYGNMDRLRYGSDSFGNLCGTKNSGFDGAIDATGLPNLHYVTPWIKDGPKLCVAACTPKYEQADMYKHIVCTYGYTLGATSNSDAVSKLSASPEPPCYWSLAETTVLNRCVPTQLLAIAVDGSTSTTTNPDAATTDLNARAVANEIWADIMATWRIILIACGMAIVISFVWLLVIRWFAPLVVWTTIIISTIGLWAATAYFWYSYYCSINAVTAQLRLYSGNTHIDSALYNQQTLLALSIIFSVIALSLTVIAMLARQRIKLAIAVIVEASKALRSMPALLFVPFIKNIFLSVVFAWCIWILLLLASSGTNIATNLNDAQADQTGQTFKPNQVLNFLQIYYVFGLFWSWWLLLAVLQCTIAGAIGTWYWSLDKSSRGLPRLPIARAFGRTLRYHLGSLAFGSLILAVLSTIRAILAYASYQAGKAPNNKVLKACLACLQCCLACFERFLKFLNTNAYIEVAIYGTSFMTSAKRAFELIWRNAFRVAVVTQVSGLILLLGKLMVVMLVMLATLGMTQSSVFLSGVGENINGRYWSITLIVVMILAWMIASSFTAVLQMTIDTIFLCFCEDSEKNDGSAERPYYMPPSLRQLMAGKASAVPSKVEVQSTPAPATQAKAYY